MAYATYTDVIARYDERTVADLCSDSGNPSPDLASDGNIAAALAGASGRVNSAVQVGGLYDTADLEGLAGDDLAFLKDLVCDLAMARLIRRRPSPENTEWAQSIEQPAGELLDAIRKGQNLFNISRVKEDAGRISVDGPTTVDYDNLRLLRDRMVGFYPRRSLPQGRE